MHCALRRAHSDFQKGADRERDSLSRNDQTSFRTSLQKCEVPSATWRNSNRRIKELVRGDGNSHSKVYGDPTKLDSVNLNDLHPRSWYSVAWYPIYRIPDGNFRAAFLTYHSLGCLVRRSANFESPSMDDCIVSPVVGLQSYNAQGECWFQPRPSVPAQTIVTNLNPCGILEERLRTLEESASIMARAVVSKGSTTSVNRYPDYEFFLSRRR